MPIKNNNTASGISPGNKFQVGISDVDNGQIVEQGVDIPWPNSPQASYLYYDCTIGVMLDSGIVVHNRLPQVNNLPDTLSSTDLTSAQIDQVTDRGVNLKCRDQYADIVQRMGHSRYWFCMWGQALRVGYQVPIPGIKTIGGVPAIPYDKNPQWACNSIFPGGNYSGVILWRAQWSLWYTTAVPPINQTIPAVDPSAHIRGDSPLPDSIQAPFSQADDNAVPTAPLLKTIGPVTGATNTTNIIPGKIR